MTYTEHLWVWGGGGWKHSHNVGVGVKNVHSKCWSKGYYSIPHPPPFLNATAPYSTLPGIHP